MHLKMHWNIFDALKHALNSHMHHCLKDNWNKLHWFVLWTVKKKKLHVLLVEVAVYLFDGMPNTGDGLFVFFSWTSFVEIAEKMSTIVEQSIDSFVSKRRARKFLKEMTLSKRYIDYKVAEIEFFYLEHLMLFLQLHLKGITPIFSKVTTRLLHLCKDLHS